MANLRYVTARRNGMMEDIRAALAGGSIKVYNGPQPANGDLGLAGNTLLVTLGLSSPAGPPTANGAFTFGAITSGVAIASAGPNPASWARMFQADGTTPVGDMDVALTGATFNLDNVNIVQGGTISAVGTNTLSVPPA
jgi:hypothetical protein